MDITYNSNKFLTGSKEFLNNNSFIAKVSFIILVIICFIIFFNIGYWIIKLIISPSRSPYIIKGMKDAKTLRIIGQNPKDANSISIYRSNDQYNGIEFTWSTWFYIDDPTYNSDALNNIFVKGSPSSSSVSNNKGGQFMGSNCPGVYLKPSNYTNDQSNYGANNMNPLTMKMLISLDIFPFKDTITDIMTYKHDVSIDKIPIKKWINLIIRSSSQNIVDIFINGSLINRVKLPSLIRQNYDKVYVNANGGFDGFVSNLKYYNYAIGTFEIDRIINSGPNLTMEGNNMTQSYPYYLSTKWLFGEKYTS